MKTITKDELKVCLRKHELWLTNDPSGERADLSGANLSGADLSGANLSRANLIEANLSRANLYSAELYRANLYKAELYRAELSEANLSLVKLSGAYLSGAYLGWADLSEANLIKANLSRADLSEANLYRANLSLVNLSEANLSRANLYRANLYRADLSEANLIEANLYSANLGLVNLSGATNINYPISCPEKGSFIAFKKANTRYIVELLIPEDAMRCSATSRKCRCSKAKVLSITNLDGTESDLKSVPSTYDSGFVYTVGETVSVNNFNENRWDECSTGIHFFITRQEAVEY